MENSTILTIAAIIGAIGGIGGIISLFRTPQEIRKTRSDAYKTLSETVDNLSNRILILEEENIKLRERIRIVGEELSNEKKQKLLLLAGIDKLIVQMRKLNIDPVWTPGNEITKGV